MKWKLIGQQAKDVPIQNKVLTKNCAVPPYKSKCPLFKSVIMQFIMNQTVLLYEFQKLRNETTSINDHYSVTDDD